MNNKKTLHFSLIFVGLCFFFNPYFAAVDILPDFIGALLVALGLLQSARLFAPMADALRAFLMLAAIDFAKSVMLVFVFGMSQMGEQETLILIVAFLSATVGVLFAVRAVRLLFEGLYTMASREECAALYATGGARYSSTERMGRFAVFFVIFKEALSLLPEFAALASSTYLDSELIRIYDYIGTMRILVMVPVLGVGVAYLVLLSRYFIRLSRERDFRARLAARYEAFMGEHPGIRVRARHAVALTLIGAGLLLLADFYLDFQNIIPDPLGAVLLLAGLVLLRLPHKTTLTAGLLLALFGAFSAISSHKSYLFSATHVAADITRSEAVAAEYQTMWLFSLAEFLLFLAALALLLLALRKTLIKWGGYRPAHADEAFEARNAKKVHDEFDWQFIKCYILGFLSGLASFLFDYLKSWPSDRIFRLMEGFWILDLALALLFAIYTCYILSLMMGKIKERFQFE